MIIIVMTASLFFCWFIEGDPLVDYFVLTVSLKFKRCIESSLM